MTTYTQFSPAPDQPFQFSAELDGATYNVIVTQNLFGQRWYVNVYDNTGNLIISFPLIASPNTYDISLIATLGFSSTLIYRDSTNNFEVSP